MKLIFFKYFKSILNKFGYLSFMWSGEVWNRDRKERSFQKLENYCNGVHISQILNHKSTQMVKDLNYGRKVRPSQGLYMCYFLCTICRYCITILFLILNSLHLLRFHNVQGVSEIFLWEKYSFSCQSWLKLEKAMSCKLQSCNTISRFLVRLCLHIFYIYMCCVTYI